MHGAVNAANDTKGLRTAWYVGENPAELDQVSTVLRGDGFKEHTSLTYSGAGERNFITEFTRRALERSHLHSCDLLWSLTGGRAAALSSHTFATLLSRLGSTQGGTPVGL